MDKLIAKKEKADAECDWCETRFPLWDALERKFASDAVRRQVEELQAEANLSRPFGADDLDVF